MNRRGPVVFPCVLLVAVLAVPIFGQGRPPSPAAVDQSIPRDLRPLLQPRQSEMRLVVLRYTQDRVALTGNFLGGPRGAAGGGRGSSVAVPIAAYPSPGRIARLKRFDLDWQAALGRLDVTKLSPAAKSDLDKLVSTIASNSKQLEDDSAALAQVSPIVPFAPAIVQLVESRIRLETVDPEGAAGVLSDITRQVVRMSARIEGGLGASPAADGLRIGKELATRGAAAADALRSGLGEWFAFYNGYDPLFTWWVGVPFKKADAALQGYSALLKDKVAAADLGSSNVIVPQEAGIAPAPAPKFPSVPDLAGILALPQDEMSAIVQRFRGSSGRGGRGGAEASQGARGAQSVQPPTVRDRKFYQDWLAALRTLRFETLTRNAQVDYLYIRKTAEQQLARFGVTLPANPPRKADASGITGAARGRQGLVFDLQDELIPYSPEQLIALAEKEFEWCDAEMKKASSQMGFGADWKRAIEKVKEIHPPPGDRWAWSAT